jgi:hypothetical protein
MPIIDDQERNILGGGLLLIATSATALGSALAVEAWDHMAFAAGLCGPTNGHCLACYAAVGSLLVALVTGAASAAVFRTLRRGSART